MVHQENAKSVTNRVEFKPKTVYPMPAQMGKSSYTIHFPNFNNSQRRDVSPTKLNVELESNEIFTKVREKNNFKGETSTTTGETFDLINEKLKQMKKHRDQRMQERAANLNIYH